MCRRSSGAWSPSRLACWSGWSLARSLICSICLVLALSTPAWSETSPPSEPDWLELTRYLDVIDSGLSMTENASDEIENSQQQREQLLTETERRLSERKFFLSQREVLLSEREQGLSEREQDLQQRESSYDAMQASLDAASEKISQQRTKSLFLIASALLVGGLTGWVLSDVF